MTAVNKSSITAGRAVVKRITAKAYFKQPPQPHTIIKTVTTVVKKDPTMAKIAMVKCLTTEAMIIHILPLDIPTTTTAAPKRPATAGVAVGKRTKTRATIKQPQPPHILTSTIVRKCPTTARVAVARIQWQEDRALTRQPTCLRKACSHVSQMLTCNDGTNDIKSWLLEEWL